MERIERITSTQRRRRYSGQKKHSLLLSPCNQVHLFLLFPDSMYCTQFAV
ncbi:hypothetical protein [Acinetobacter sp. ANC 4640]